MDIGYGDKSLGDDNLLAVLMNEISPKIHIFGHNHDGTGFPTCIFTKCVGACTVTLKENKKMICVNAAQKLARKAIVFDYVLP